MPENKNNHDYALLFFPKRKEKIFTMYVSSPPPTWLDGKEMTGITVCEPGVYCLFFLVLSHRAGRAYITVNGREIRGSGGIAKRGIISGSAVCSIREPALPCKLGISTEAGAGEGMIFVFKYNV